MPARHNVPDTWCTETAQTQPTHNSSSLNLTLGVWFGSGVSPAGTRRPYGTQEISPQHRYEPKPGRTWRIPFYCREKDKRTPGAGAPMGYQVGWVVVVCWGAGGLDNNSFPSSGLVWSGGSAGAKITCLVKLGVDNIF